MWSYLEFLGTFLSRMVPLPAVYPMGFLSIFKIYNLYALQRILLMDIAVVGCF
jgi:hypothetical protein